jgi:hypothetical protein
MSSTVAGAGCGYDSYSRASRFVVPRPSPLQGKIVVDGIWLIFNAFTMEERYTCMGPSFRVLVTGRGIWISY